MYRIAIRICSSHKADVEGKVEPCQLYTAPMIQAFHRFCTEHKIHHAVLSRKNGIMRDDLKFAQYGDIAELDRPDLLAKLQKQCRGVFSPNCTVFYYWNPRPLTGTTWVHLLREAGFSVEDVRGSLEDLLAAIKKDEAEELAASMAPKPIKTGPQPRAASMKLF